MGVKAIVRAPSSAWGIGGSVIAADCGVQSPFIRAMGGGYLRCATSVIAGQYATSSCKPLLVRVSL